jgi:hypothetical protein
MYVVVVMLRRCNNFAITRKVILIICFWIAYNWNFCILRRECCLFRCGEFGEFHPTIVQPCGLVPMTAPYKTVEGKFNLIYIPRTAWRVTYCTCRNFHFSLTHGENQDPTSSLESHGHFRPRVNTAWDRGGGIGRYYNSFRFPRGKTLSQLPMDVRAFSLPFASHVTAIGCTNCFCEISGFHGGEYEYVCLLGCYAM